MPATCDMRLNAGMRASVQEQKGGIGAHEVAGAFERINWGVAFNSVHDLGTDLFLTTREHRLIDLGMVVGAQVKAGPHFFKEAVRDTAGAVSGWWFRESTREHFDAWLGHQLPHIIVLHNIETRITYWAHITKDAVRFTRKGAKIFVPAENTVDERNADKLLAVAVSNTPQTSWDGTAWSGADLSPSHQLRHALLVPRLIAPHPNRSTAIPPTAAQIVAMLIQVRFRDIAELVRLHDSIPNLDDLQEDITWEWRFAASLDALLRTGLPDKLYGLIERDGPPHEQAAATAAYAAALVEDGRTQEALTTLQNILDRDELDLVDHAWMQLHHARALSELGHAVQARDEAITLIGLAQRAPNDVTAAAIGGAAANTVFAVSDWESHDLATTISASDTTAVWWRQQVSSWGLSAQAEKVFRHWASDHRVRHFGDDEAWQYMRSASLLAGLLGDHGAWRHTTQNLADYILSDHNHGADTNNVASALTTLRRCGDHKGVELAARRVVLNGPAIAARTAALEIDPASSTTTSAYADLRLLIEAGDLLPVDRATELADWARLTVLHPDVYVGRIRPTFVLAPVLLELMTVLVDAVDNQARHHLADFVLDLPSKADPAMTIEITRLIARLPTAVWTCERGERAAARANTAREPELTYVLLGIAATHVPHAREQLEEDARRGTLAALASLGHVANWDTDLATSVVASLTSRIEAQIDDAARGRFSAGGPDLGRGVVVLNVWNPTCANWDIVYQLLSSTPFGDHLVGALRLLANTADKLPDDVAANLIPLAQTIAEGPEPKHQLFNVVDARPAARRLQATLQRRAGDPSIDHLTALIRGSLDDRRNAAMLAGSGRDDLAFGVLIALANDPEPNVRALAAMAITERAASGESAARSQLGYLVNDPGVLVARQIAAAADGNPKLAALAELQPLQNHVSARVRTAFRSS